MAEKEATGSAPPKVPWLETATLVYLFAPHFLFFAGWLNIFWAVTASLALAVVLFLALRSYLLEPEGGKLLRPTKVTVVVCLIIAIACSSLTGAGGVGALRPDWKKHNAVFKDLIVHEWPVAWPEIGPEKEVGDFRLVYYLAYYIAPAFVGKWLSWQGANIALYVSTLIGVWLSLIWFSRLSGCKSAYSAFWLCMFFVLAGGWDVVGHLWRFGWPFELQDLFETWSPVGNYKATIGSLVWAPQHTLGGWLPTFLALDQYFSRRRGIPVVMPLLAALLWTPFAAVGLLPFCLLTAVSFMPGRNEVQSQTLAAKMRLAWGLALPQLIAAAASLLLLLIIGSYYASLAKPPPPEVPRLDFAWVLSFLVFFGLKVGIYLTLIGTVYGIKDRLDDVFDMRLIVVFTAALLFIPLVRVGESNDFVMRVSIPVLLAMRVLLGQIVLRLARLKEKKRLAVFLLVSAVGAVVPLMEIARSIKYGQFACPDYNSVPPVHLCTRLRHYYIGDAGRDTMFFTVFSKKPGGAASRGSDF